MSALWSVTTLLLLCHACVVRSQAAESGRDAAAAAGRFRELVDWVVARCVSTYETCALTSARCGDLGDQCSSHAACRSGRCRQDRCVACLSDDDCPSRQFCLFSADGSLCVSRLASGAACLTNRACASGTCCDHVCKSSCHHVLPVQAHCTDDSQCASRHCDLVRGRCSYPPNVRACAGHWYLHVADPMVFTDAQDNCVQHGGHLATPRSAEQNHCVTFVSQGRDTWLGYTCHGRGRVFEGLDGLGRLSYDSWPPSQPDNYEGRQECVALWNSAREGVWDDMDCSLRYPSICQVPPLC